MMQMDTQPVIHLVVALGIGLLIGAERERSKSTVAEKISEGVRTFALATLLGAMSAMMHFWLFVTAIGSVLVLASVAYHHNMHAKTGLTTEVALIFSTFLGGLCVIAPEMAAAIAIVVVILLSAKATIHGFVLQVLSTEDLRNFLILAASTLIILPLVPNAFVGPFQAINPRYLWLIVIMVMLVSAISHIVIRHLDVRIGLPVVGLLSGFISSIATINTMGKQSTDSPALLHAAVAGAVFSSLATILQLSILLAVIDVATLWQMAWPLTLGALSITSYGLLISANTLHQGRPDTRRTTNSFSATSAVLMAAMIALVLLVSAALKHWFGQPGLIAISLFAGFADVHAPTIAVATLAAKHSLTHSEAIAPILAAYSGNACTKALVALLSRNRPFYRPVILGLLIQLAAVWLGWGLT